MIENSEISLELNRAVIGTYFCTLISIDKYMEYAKQGDLIFRHFPILDCGFIMINDKAIILRTEEKGTTTLSTKTMLI